MGAETPKTLDVGLLLDPRMIELEKLEIQLEHQLGAMRRMIYAIFGRDLEQDEGTEVGLMVDWINGLRAENTKMKQEYDAALAECRKRKGIEQDRDAYKQLLGSLFIYAQSGRVAGHQLSEQERDILFAECERALQTN
jgi:hypothetical protein